MMHSISAALLVVLLVRQSTVDVDAFGAGCGRAILPRPYTAPPSSMIGAATDTIQRVHCLQTSPWSRDPSKSLVSRFAEPSATTDGGEATTTATLTRDTTSKELLAERKRSLLGLLGTSAPVSSSPSAASKPTVAVDPVLASPITKRPLVMEVSSPSLEGGSRGVKVTLTPLDLEEVGDGLMEKYSGRTDTFYNLLEAEGDSSAENDDGGKEGGTQVSELARNLLNAGRVFVPPPLRAALAFAGTDGSYVPMRDLFTSPAVSYAYERGWRQGFAAAGFPGPDAEFELIKEYFAPAVAASVGGGSGSVVVDMSCATGLMTRRLAKSGLYDRVIGCDYSESMLTEARRRISTDEVLKPQRASSSTRLDLVRCDVARIPMRTESVDALHAGAAMHCWPEVEVGLAEIYRVLKPGGRFFATTFLYEYFRSLQRMEGGAVSPQQQAFQYFESKEQLRDMMVRAGFKEENVSVEILGRACVVIRCEK